jgi:quercetin dioxygenase-like cupin family protein
MEAQAGNALTPFEIWMKKEGVPVVTGHSVDVRTVPLGPWPRLKGRGALADLIGFEGVTSMIVAEIPGGGALEPERHLFEEVIYVLEGRGGTAVWADGKGKQTFEWQAGSLFALPLNSWHQHFNGVGNEPARFLALTTAPMVLDTFRDEEFVFQNSHHFADRYSGEMDYFIPSERRFEGTSGDWTWETNFVPDVYAADLYPFERKVSGGDYVAVEMAGNALMAHITSFPVGHYHKAHYHFGGAVILILQGKGYSLMWPKDLGPQPFSEGKGEQVVRIPWHDGVAFSPPDGWFHQHFNTCREPARQLAIRYGSRHHLPRWVQARWGGGAVDRLFTSVSRGGCMIDKEDEDPMIQSLFAKALHEEGSL